MASKLISKKTKELLVIGSYILILLIFASFEANRKEAREKMPPTMAEQDSKTENTGSNTTTYTSLKY